MDGFDELNQWVDSNEGGLFIRRYTISICGCSFVLLIVTRSKYSIELPCWIFKFCVNTIF